VPNLEEGKPGAAPKSLRERMEQHRKNPVCSSCHAQMDPIGFALENYDGIGRWRETDSGAKIDAVSQASDGTTIAGSSGLRPYLAARSSEFVRTVTEKLLTYALGRELDYYDAPTVRQIVRDAAKNDYRWSSVLTGIVSSVPFQQRQAADEPRTVTASARAEKQDGVRTKPQGVTR
jgi:hypothetical protein